MDDDIQQLIKTVTKISDAVNKMDKKLDVHIAIDAETHKISRGNQDILKGRNGDPGLISKVSKNTDDIKEIKKIAWAIMTPVLFAVGAGIVYIIAMGVGE